MRAGADTADSPAPEEKVSRRGLSWLALLAIALLGLLPALTRQPPSDEAWLIYIAKQMLRGARLGVDYLEVTPPPAIWKSFLPVLLERVTPMSAWIWTVLLMGALAAIVLRLTWRALRSGGLSARPARQLLIAAALVCLVMPGVEFSEREHLALLLTLPYVALAGSRGATAITPGALAIGSGVLAGLGLSLKPHFALALMLLESREYRRIGRARWSHPDLRALIATLAATVLAVLVFTPQYLPMAIRLAPIYAAYLDHGVIYTLGLAGPALLLTLLAAVSSRLTVPAGHPYRDVFLLASLGFLAAAVIQRKGLSYHFLAASGFGFLSLVAAWQARAAHLGWKPSGIIARAGILLLILLPAHWVLRTVDKAFAPEPTRHGGPDQSKLLARVTALGGNRSVLLMASNPAIPWPFALETGAVWASRYPSMWPLAAFYDREVRQGSRPIAGAEVSRQTDAERRFVEEVIEDLVKFAPTIVIVLTPDPSDRGWGGARRIDYLAYFERSPLFSQVLNGYSEVDKEGVYRLWVRNGR